MTSGLSTKRVDRHKDGGKLGLDGPALKRWERRRHHRRLVFGAANALADWLTEHGECWRWFGHLTFSSCRDLDYARRTWLRWLERVNRQQWGRHWRRKLKRGDDVGVWGFVAWEQQKRGDWHAHFLLAGVTTHDELGRAAAVNAWVNLGAGCSWAQRIESFDREQGGAGYAAKYVSKEASGRGSWDLFGQWRHEVVLPLLETA